MQQIPPTLASVAFTGSGEAELFTHQVTESLAGVLTHNYRQDPNGGEVGFSTASLDGRVLSDTMWSRDVATLIRELAYFGGLEEAKNVFDAMVARTAPNEHGYQVLPMLVRVDDCVVGSELDGTALFVMAAIQLLERTSKADPRHEDLIGFLVGPQSPIRFALDVLERDRFVAGTGEFGGGLEFHELPVHNVVQNALVLFSLEAAATRLPQLVGASIPASFWMRCKAVALELAQNIRTEMVRGDGTWLWALDPQTGHEVADEVSRAPSNVGFGGVNAVLAASAEIHGLDPLAQRRWFLEPSLLTFWRLFSNRERMEQFARHGMWSQFEQLNDGLLTSAYGQGYATQCMLLVDRPELYSQAVSWLVRATANPVYSVTRASRHWFYERYVSPDARGREWIDEGCGALNIVNVTESTKIARLIAGLDDSRSGELLVIPRLPFGWTGISARGLVVSTGQGSSVIDLDVDADESGRILRVRLASERPLDAVRVRLGSADRHKWVVHQGRTIECSL